VLLQLQIGSWLGNDFSEKAVYILAKLFKYQAEVFSKSTLRKAVKNIFRFEIFPLQRTICQTDIFRITGKIRQANFILSNRKMFHTAQLEKILKKLFHIDSRRKRKGARG
jgi:hypothetical protein